MLEMPALLAAFFDLNGRPHYLHSGWFLISVANLVVIVAMIVVFVLAIFVPFPRDKSKQ
jgi:ABC-type protease/lipase transport system fused ATPase/permease subunit